MVQFYEIRRTQLDAQYNLPVPILRDLLKGLFEEFTNAIFHDLEYVLHYDLQYDLQDELENDLN